MAESDSDANGIWGVLALAGVLGVCCLSLTALTGGAAVAGGAVAGVTAASGTVSTLGGFLVVALATALPLVAIGLFLSRGANSR